MNKKTLVFDASVIAENLCMGSGRSGIYFTAYNILKQLKESDDFNISLFCENLCNEDFSVFVEKNFGKNIKIYFGNRYKNLLIKLSDLDEKLLKSHHNILKLLLNIFVRKPIRYIGLTRKLVECDVFISPLRVVSKKIKAKKSYIILYDTIPLLFPQYYPEMKLKKYWFYDLVKYIKSKPDCKYFAISENTKQDFIKLLNMNHNNISVIHLAANDSFYKNKNRNICKKYGIPDDKKYVFSLCTLEPRKNLIRAVKTFIEFIKKKQY